ncbi:MAG TPA: sigma-70 family RNA polymerase sigma factor [Candidatus Paceibacterota bacterium]|jgi:RNA polymerase sigma-70 factor (ECF subfamily)|nr:sigma-70 family RNA polymerase sigma factor [Candidatus Paceibacterota bacterium]
MHGNESSKDKEQHFFDMVEAYQDAIFRFIYFRVNNRAVALDITQDTFTKTWLYLAGGKTIDYPEAFLYRTARNAVIDYFKKSKSASLDTLMEAGFDPGSTKTVDDVFRDDDIETVRALVETLDEESQQIIFMRYTEEKPIEQIADIFGTTINAMTVRIHRIVKKLRSRFDEKENNNGQ